MKYISWSVAVLASYIYDGQKLRIQDRLSNYMLLCFSSVHHSSLQHRAKVSTDSSGEFH
jgi:hypothetical protein